MFEVVTRRFLGGVEVVSPALPTLETAQLVRDARAVLLQKRGFKGRINGVGFWHLTKREDGKRVRVTVFIRETQPEPLPAYSLN